MTPDDTRRPVTLDRTSNGHYSVSNERGGTISVGNGSDDSFTPVELLLTAIGACTAIAAVAIVWGVLFALFRTALLLIVRMIG